MALQINSNRNSNCEINFWYSFQPIYCISRIIGIIPFSIKRNRSGEIIGTHVSFFDFFWFMTSIIGYIAISASCYIITKPLKTTSNLAIDGGSLAIIIAFAFFGIFVILNMLNRNRFIVIIKTIEAFDQKVIYIEIITIHYPYSIQCQYNWINQ